MPSNTRRSMYVRLGVVAFFLALVPSRAMASTITINQAPPNFTISTAQPISPLFFPPSYTMTNVLGNGTAGGPGDLGFYAINVNANDNLHLALVSTTTPLRPTELSLYTENQTLVAIASTNAPDGLGSIIDFTIPIGDAGTWFAEVTVSPFDTDKVLTPIFSAFRARPGSAR